MLKKLLKYDFLATFKIWWIAAVTSLGLSFLGGYAVTLIRAPRDLPQVVDASAGLMLFISIFSLFTFAILSEIIILVRFYKNFFTDEGYLTFTLPVKTGSLINSKLIMSVVVTLTTLIVLAVNVCVILGIGFFDVIVDKELFKYVAELIDEVVAKFGAYLFIYILEAIVIFVLGVVFSLLLMFCCITLASIITKKGRVATAIAIYYGVNCVLSFVMEMIMIFGVRGIGVRMEALSDKMINSVMAVILLAVILLFGLASVMLYTLQYRMIDKRLNLN